MILCVYVQNNDEQYTVICFVVCALYECLEKVWLQVSVFNKKQSFSMTHFIRPFSQDKGTPDIVLKAMGRAINKTVNIAEIIKV
jgi:hypothetical protein